jgi:hypothetical protein
LSRGCRENGRQRREATTARIMATNSSMASAENERASSAIPNTSYTQRQFFFTTRAPCRKASRCMAQRHHRRGDRVLSLQLQHDCAFQDNWSGQFCWHSWRSTPVLPDWGGDGRYSERSSSTKRFCAAPRRGATASLFLHAANRFNCPTVFTAIRHFDNICRAIVS